MKKGTGKFNQKNDMLRERLELDTNQERCRYVIIHIS
jgi:hypothetical protein